MSRVWSHICLHHSLTADGKVVDTTAIKRYHTSWRYDGRIITSGEAQILISQGKHGVIRPWADIGYHYTIERVGDDIKVMDGRSLEMDGAHCLEGGMNENSIGVCLVPGSLILSETGYRPIEDIRVGEYVYGKKGLTRVVNTVKLPYSGEVVSFRTKYSADPIVATLEHPFYSVRPGRLKCKWGGVCRNTSWWCRNKFPRCSDENWGKFPAEWVRAGDLASGDWVSIPKTWGGSFAYIDKVGMEEYNSCAKIRRVDLPTLELDSDLGKFVGLYIAEGSIYRNRIAFYFHSKETDLISFVVDYCRKLGLRAGVYDMGKYQSYKGNPVQCSSVHVTSVPLSRFLSDNGGCGAHSKHIPPFTFGSIKEFQKGLLEGMNLGDGYRRYNRNENIYVTVSKRLAYEYAQLHHSLYGEVPSVRKSQSVMNGKRFESYYVSTNSNEKPSRNSQTLAFVDGLDFVQIQSSILLSYVGDVFNLETEDNTFVVQRVLCHNCLIGNMNYPDEKREPPGSGPPEEAKLIALGKLLIRLHDEGRWMPPTAIGSEMLSFVVGHRDYAFHPYPPAVGQEPYKLCPGSAFDIDSLRKLATEYV